MDKVTKVLICALALFVIAAAFSLYMFIHPANAFDRHFFSGMSATFAVCVCYNIYIIYDYLKRK